MTCYYGIKNDGAVNVTPSSTKKFKDLPVLSCKSCDEFWMEMQKLPSVKKIEWFFGTLPDLSAARPLPRLEELSFLGIRKLSDIHGISVLKNTLKRLRFDFGSGKTITDWSPIGELSELEELVICNNSVISDLHFLETLPKLKSFRIVSVKIQAEDLSPLKNIEQVCFFKTGIDKKLKSFLSEKQMDFMNQVKERIEVLTKDYK